MPDLITSRYNLNKIFPSISSNIKNTLKSNKIDIEEAQYIRKGLIPRDMRFEEGENAIVSYITTNAKDRDNEIVDPKGAILDDYLNNPVVMYCHNYFQMPIGKCDGIKRDNKGLIAKTIYYDKGLGQEIFDYRKSGFPMGESIGFIPIEWKEYNKDEDTPEAKEGVRRKYTKWILLEYSDVPIPSNPEALTIAVSKGIMPAKIEDVDGEGNYTLLLESEDKYIHFKNKVDKNRITEILLDFGGLLRKEDLGPFDIDEFCEKNRIDIFEKSETEYSFSGLEKKELDFKETGEGKAKYKCECIKCGWKTETDKHCNDIKCKECGGEMRRVERPGPGKDSDDKEVTKPGWDENETSFRYQVRNPDTFRRDTFRTVPIKKDKPRVNSVMGKLKKNEGKEDDPMILQSLIFPKEDDWTLADAKKWLKEHDDLLKSIEDILEILFKEFFEATLKITNDEIEKTGRTLSAKTRKTMTQAVSAMTTAVNALNILLEESDKQDDDKTVKPKRSLSYEEMESLLSADDGNGDKKTQSRTINEMELRGLFKTVSDDITSEKRQKETEDILRKRGVVQL